MAKKNNGNRKIKFNTKRCWSCNTHMQVNVDRCPSCGRKVGDINPHGVGKKPIDWKNYILSLGAAAVLVYFIWWGFFKG